MMRTGWITSASTVQAGSVGCGLHRCPRTWATGIYGPIWSWAAHGRSRIRNSLNQSRATTCRDFACGVREIRVIFARSRKTGSKLAGKAY